MVVVLLGAFQSGEFPPRPAIETLGMIWLTFLLSWLVMRPLHTTVRWAWSSYAVAQAKTDEARRGQGQLAQLSKSLNEACDRLERLNRELEEAREAAEQARRMKAEFAATVGHELRTPVNLIIGFSEMMASPRRSTYYDEPLPDAYRADLEVIHRNARHISSLVDDILDLSQIDAHRLALRKERMEVAQVVEDAVANVAALYADAGLSLSVDVPSDLPSVPADPVRVRQTLINLLYNAVRFTHQGGVTLLARRVDDEVVLEVRDTGVGIPAEDLPRLFEEFRQLGAPTRGHVGSGLGLALCKRFVELHGGSIWAESAVGRGTTVSFSLPLRENIAVTPLRRMALAPLLLPSQQPVVGVLDFTGDTARVFQRYLDGYRVRPIRRLAQAHQAQRDGELRAMIVATQSDQHAWYEYQKAHPPLQSVPTLVCLLRTRRAIAESLGAAEYLVKPVTTEQLARTLRRLGRCTRNLLVIEDDVEMRAFLTRALDTISSRFQVVVAENGATGLDLARQSRPDAVLLDLLMPSTDGYAVLRAMQEDATLRGVPVIVISARGPDEGITASLVGVGRQQGLTVGEAMSSLKINLDALSRRSGPSVLAWNQDEHGVAPGPRAGSPV